MRIHSRDWELLYSGGLVLVALVLAGCDAAPDSTRTSTAGSSGPATPVVAHDASVPRIETPAPQPMPATQESVSSVAPVDAAVARAAWSEGVRLFDGRSYAAAAEQLRVAAAGRAEDAYTHYLLGLALWKSGRAEEAVTALDRSAGLGPGSIRTWINLARVHLDQDDTAAALEAAESALAIDPSSADALHQKGRALAKLGQTGPAIEVLARAHDVAPDNGFVANTLGLLLLQSGRSAEAVPLLEAAREQLPGVAYVRNNLAVAYERTGQIELAVAEYRAAVGAGDSGGKGAASLARLRAPIEPETPSVETARSESPIAELPPRLD